jgi:hypothetical protein
MEVIQTPDGKGGRIKEIIEKDYYVLENLKKFYDGQGMQTFLTNTEDAEKWKLTVRMAPNRRDNDNNLYGIK